MVRDVNFLPENNVFKGNDVEKDPDSHPLLWSRQPPPSLTKRVTPMLALVRNYRSYI